jgi:hypothetical protein
MGQLVHISIIAQETLMNIDSPEEMTPCCTNQILPEKQLKRSNICAATRLTSCLV